MATSWHSAICPYNAVGLKTSLRMLSLHTVSSVFANKFYMSVSACQARVLHDLLSLNIIHTSRQAQPLRIN